LFGHGFLGGIGSFAGFLGFILQIVLIVMVARLALAWWQRRSQPAYAGPGLGVGPSPLYRGMLGGGGGGARSGGPSDGVSITPADYDAFERLLGDVETAYSNEDIAALRGLATPEMVSYFAEELADNASRGVVNRLSGVKLLQGDLAEAWREGNVDYATVAMRFSLVDQMVDRSTGRVVQGDASPQQVTEIWTFMRTRGGRWMLSAIQQA